MKHPFYFPGSTIAVLVIILFTSCMKESASDFSGQSTPGTPSVISGHESVILPIYHWIRNEDNSYVSIFSRILAPQGLIKKVKDLYISNMLRQDFQLVGNAPTTCTGGKIWYKTEGVDLKVYFIPDEGTVPPNPLYIKVYYN